MPVSEPVIVPDSDASVPPVRPARPKRAAKKTTTVVDEMIVVEEQAVQSADSVVVKPVARSRKSPVRKKTVQEPIADGGESLEVVVAPKPRKRPASRSKKSATVAVDEGKE
jgi:ribonuclease E